jgi:Uma2 family endonuclease
MKIIVEKDQSTEEISKEKLEEMQRSPDFMVEVLSSTDSEKHVKIKERLLD